MGDSDFSLWETYFGFTVRALLRHADFDLIYDWLLFDTRAYPLIVAFWWMICWLQLLMPMNSHLKDLIDHACTLRHTPFIEIIWSFVDFMIVWYFCWFVWVITLSVYHFSLSSLSLLLFSPKPFSFFLIIDRSFILVSILGVLGWKSRTHPLLSLIGLSLIIPMSFVASFRFSFLYSILFLKHHLRHTPFTTQRCSLPLIPEFIIIPMPFMTSFHFNFLCGILFLERHLRHTPFIA